MSTLPDREAAFALLDRVLEGSRADETEAILIAHDSGLTRFADSGIHQNVAEEDLGLLVRVAVDGRVAGARTNRLADADRIAARAVEIARQTPADPHFPGLAGPQPPREVPERFVAATAGATPLRRAEGVRDFIAACPECSAAGALRTAGTAVAVRNSRGVRAYGRVSGASIIAVVQRGEGSAYVRAGAADLEGLDLAAFGRRAQERATAAARPGDLEPGTYPVILEPDAVALMLGFLGSGTFNGKAYVEGRSALSTRLGEQVADPRVQVWDDPGDARTLGLPFDFEGVPKHRLDLIRDGLAVGIAHDTRTAALAEVPNTGRALPQPNAWGPVPISLVMEPGEASLDDMIASTERAILVTRFHYVRWVHPVRTVITGMTRDGTFLVEDGRITRALKNMRFNHGILDALSAVEAIGRDGVLIPSEWDELFTTWAPPIKVREFTFTSRTLF